MVTTATALTTPPTSSTFHQAAPLDVTGPSQYRPIAAGPGEPPPVRLVIPVLNLSAAVESLGVTQDYTLQAPAGVSDVAWYRYGPSPGFAGDAIISGHRGYPAGIPAIFNGIGRLHAGDEIDVQLADGNVARFAVTRIYLTPHDTVPAGFFATDGVPRLTLVTCAGDFRATDLTYRDRLVVEARPVASKHQGER